MGFDDLFGDFDEIFDEKPKENEASVEEQEDVWDTERVWNTGTIWSANSDLWRA